MYRKILVIILLIFVVLTQYNCAPSIRSAKIQPGFAVEGAVLGTMYSAKATDELGNDVTAEDVEWGMIIPFDVKFRYGWERKNSLGFELSAGLDGQMGAYLELPGSDFFHWGIGAETNMWLYAFSSSFEDNDDDDVARFLSDNNYHAYLMAGVFPNEKFELSLGMKYQPFLQKFLEAISEAEIDAGNTMPVSFLVDARYMFAKHWGFILGTEFFSMSFKGDLQQTVSLAGGYIYLGLTYR